MIEIAIRKALFNFRIYFLFLTATIVILTLWLIVSYKKQLASIAVAQAQPALIKGDYRGAIVGINLSVGSDFKFVLFRTADDQVPVVIPPGYEDPSLGYSFTIDVKPLGFQEAIGSVEFGLNLSPLILLALFLFALGVAAMVFLSRRMAKRLREDYDRSLVIEQKEAFNRLATQVSHDIRSPLSALNFALASLNEIPDEKRLIIKNAAERINEIARDLLEKYESPSAFNVIAEDINKPDLKLETVVLSDLIEHIIKEKQLVLPSESKIVISLDIADDLKDLTCRLDKKVMSRVLSNIINNAIEACDKDGRIIVALRDSKEVISIIINDNGKGIPQDVLRRLGKERISYGKNKTDSGTGIGVLHARQSVENMGGSFTIQSRVGVGTQVTISFPKSAHTSTTSLSVKDVNPPNSSHQKKRFRAIFR